MLPPPDVTIPVTVAIVLALLGGALLVSGARQYWIQHRAVSRAEQASGTIDRVDIRPVIDGNGSTSYVPVVEYEYQTPTQRFRGDAIYPGRQQLTKLFHSESAARAPITGYEPGAPTTVYYDRADPDHSFLIPQLHRGPDVAKIIFGLGLVGLGVVVLTQTGVV